MTLMLLGVALSLALSAFFSGTESGFYFVRKERLRVLEAQGHHRAKRLLKMMASPGALVCTMLVGNNLALQVGTDSAMRYIAKGGWDHPWITAEILTTLLLFFPFFIFGEVLPKATYRLYSQDLLLRTLPVIQLFRWLFWPISSLVGFLARLLERQVGVEDEASSSFDRDLMSKNIGLAHAVGTLSDEQLESLTQAMSSGDQPVGRMMNSLIQSPMLEMKTSVVNLLRWYEREPMVAYPVYHQKKTQVVGWVDMRKVTRSGYQGKSLKPWLEEPVTVDWSMPFHDAMNLFFEKEVPLLFVMKDERVVGFVPWVDALQRMLR